MEEAATRERQTTAEEKSNVNGRKDSEESAKFKKVHCKLVTKLNKKVVELKEREALAPILLRTMAEVGDYPALESWKAGSLSWS